MIGNVVVETVIPAFYNFPLIESVPFGDAETQMETTTAVSNSTMETEAQVN